MLFMHTSITFSLIDILQENIVDGVTTGVTAVTAIDEEDLRNNNSGKHFKSSDEVLGLGLCRNSAKHIQMVHPHMDLNQMITIVLLTILH